MIMRFVLSISLIFLSACTLSDTVVEPGKTNSGSLIGTGSVKTGTLDYQDPLIETLTGIHEEYYPLFEGIETKVIHAIHEAGKATKVSFINSSAKSMVVNITFPIDATGANLRWSQVIMPDGTMDGPFGQKTGYNLKQNGGYTLIFSENQMAGDPWSGSADIIITLRDSFYDTDTVILP